MRKGREVRIPRPLQLTTMRLKGETEKKQTHVEINTVACDYLFPVAGALCCGVTVGIEAA